MRYMRERKNSWVQKTGVAAAALFCTVLLMLLPYREVLANVQGTVSASSANIRASADPSSTVLASVLNGNKIEIIEEVTGTDGNKWYKVVIDADSTGYIRSDLVTKGEGSVPSASLAPSPSPSPQASTAPAAPNTNVTVNTAGVVEVKPVSASVNNDQVRVRADSSTNADIVTTVKQNIMLTVHGTKAGNNNETWYYVSFTLDNAEVTGFIRSDYVTLSGELEPPEETPAAPEESPTGPPEEAPAQVTKAYDTMDVDGVWYLIDNEGGRQYQISALFSASEQNATDLDNAQKKISRLNGIMIFLCVLLVVLVLAVTVLIFKIRDMSEDDGFDISYRRPSGSGRPSGSRPSGSRPVNTRPAGASASGTRPSGSRPAGGMSSGSRPAGGASSGSGRPAGSRPTGSAPSGSRPSGSMSSGSGRPAGSRPAGSAPSGSRPVSGRPLSQEASAAAVERKLERQAQTEVAARNLEKNTAGNPSHQSRNFMKDDDEFEFEFLNWDGDEEK